MRSLLLYCILLCGFIESRAQTIRTPVGAAYTRLSTYGGQHRDVFGYSGNQAALASFTSFAAGLYGEKRFLLNEMSYYTGAVVIPSGAGAFGLKGDYFGSAAYNESAIGLAYARRLTESVDLGVQFNYNMVNISGYGNAGAVNFDVGLLLHLTKQLRAGVHAYNPTGAKLGKNEEEKLPAIYSLGFGYDASDKFYMQAELEKVEDRPLNVNAGLQYYFDKKLLARAGVSTASSSFFLGLGFQMNALRLDATANVHPQLGLTPGLQLIYGVDK